MTAKKLHSVTVRIDDELQEQIDGYVMAREHESHATLSRAGAVREILARFFGPRARTPTCAEDPRNQ